MIFVYKCKSQWLPIAKDNVHVYIYLQITDIFAKLLYIQKARTHFAKSKTICLLFIVTASHFALREILYTKTRTLHKKHDNLRYFLYKKSWYLALRNFHERIWNLRMGGGGEEGIFICKKISLCVYIVYAKKIQFLLSFYIQNIDTLRYIFICKKTMHFASLFYI